MDNYHYKVLIEAFTVALIILILWILLDPILPGPKSLQVFTLTFIAHLGFEYFGFNEWYCKNGAACLNSKKKWI